MSKRSSSVADHCCGLLLQRLSLDANALRDSDLASQWGRPGSGGGARGYGGSTARHSDTVDYAGHAATTARHSADFTTIGASSGSSYGSAAFSGVHARVGSGSFNTAGGGSSEFTSIAGDFALQVVAAARHLEHALL